MKDESAHRDSFIVRIWRERDQPGWKGWVQHARSGEFVLFQSVDDLLAFIERWTSKLDDTTRKGLR